MGWVSGLRTAAAALALTLASGQSAAQEDFQDLDLGAKQAGQVYPLGLAAQNLNCSQDLDFRFTSQTPWLVMPRDPVVRGVPEGQSRRIQAQVDLRNLPAGRHQGFIEIECENCSFLFIQNCFYDKQVVRVLVQVQAGGAPAAPQANQPPPERIDTEGLEDNPQVPKKFRDKLRRLRDAVDVLTQSDGPCEQKLMTLREKARLDAEAAERAKDAAETAENDARYYQDQAAAAEKELKDANAASMAAESAVKAAQAALDSANTTSGRAEARAALDKAKAALAEAQKRVAAAAEAVPYFRKLAAEALKKAKQLRQAVKPAAGAAKASAAAAGAQEDECLKIKSRLAKAREELERAIREAKNAIPPPTQQLTPEEEFNNARKAHQSCVEELARTIMDQQQALLILARLGAMKDMDYESELDQWGKAIDAACDTLDKLSDYAPEGTEWIFEAADTGLKIAGTIISVAKGVTGLAEDRHVPLSSGHMPDATQKWIESEGYANDAKEAARIYKEMEGFMANGRDTGKMQEAVKRLADKCKETEKALDTAAKKAGRQP